MIYYYQFVLRSWIFCRRLIRMNIHKITVSWKSRMYQSITHSMIHTYQGHVNYSNNTQVSFFLLSMTYAHNPSTIFRGMSCHLHLFRSFCFASLDSRFYVRYFLPSLSAIFHVIIWFNTIEHYRQKYILLPTLYLFFSWWTQYSSALLMIVDWVLNIQSSHLQYVHHFPLYFVCSMNILFLTDDSSVIQ